MKTYTSRDMMQILDICTSYIASTDEESVLDYFNEFIHTGLFHDAIGRVTASRNGSVDVTENY